MNRSAGKEFGGWLSPMGAACLVASALVLMTFLVYSGIRDHGFITFDDDMYVTENAAVQGGLTLSGAAWSFTTFHASNWHPLTWLSHMADVSLFGLDAGAHHLVSLFFHLLNTVLLFFVLSRMTGSVWRSGFAAALFGVHPLHVESVAWVAERKELLSGLFFFLSLWGYARYAERPGVVRYLWVALCFVLGLLSKPMVVTLPFVLLLLDYWPLGRFPGRLSCAVPFPGRHRGGTVSSLVLEKVPLFLLSAASCAVTYLAQGGAVGTTDAFPLPSRLSNAAVSYVSYLWKMVWPSGLAMLYPHPGSVGESWPWWAVAGSALFLLCATWGAVWQWRRRPYIAVGWFWYLGMLVPVIGLVQVGLQAMADRYTYLPLAGVFVSVSWGLGEVAARPGMSRRAVCAACAGALLLLSSASWVQAGRWRDSITLFSHTLRVTQRNWLAHTNMGIALQKLGRIQEAVVQYREAIRIYPGFSAAHVNLGAAVAAQGRYSEAISEYRQAIRLSPRSLPAYINLGAALGEQGRYEDAVAACMEALKIDPYSPVVHDNLGNLLVSMGLVEEGIGHIREALRLQPDYAKARESLYRAVSVRDIRRSTGKLPGKKDK